MGISGGYGSTTWYGLVPSANKQNMAMSMSTPIHVSEGGAAWGVYAGYEFIPTFALEASYMRYREATVTFDPDSLFSFNNDGMTYLRTNTETVSLMGKVMLIIPNTLIRAYSSAGIAVEHRWDAISDHNHGTPTFGLGVNYDASEHVMTELAATYTAGYGESELEPVKDYMPFLYAVMLRIAYRI
tara:strand:+ start:1309 stop:1863 length:555 start_codon:yes stop_codon:yes gene_type:complete